MHRPELARSVSYLARGLRTFFPTSLPLEVKELIATIGILDFATSAGMLFEPIYLYTHGYSLAIIMVFYCLVYVAYFLLLPWGGHLAKRFGLKHCMMAGSVAMVVYYALLLGSAMSFGYLLLAVVAYAIQKILFWPAYHADFAHFGLSGERAREYSSLASVDILVYIVGPLLGGAIVSTFGFTAMFTIASFLILLSNIPLLASTDKYKHELVGYKECWRELTKPSNRIYVWSYLGYAEELVALTVWPIFIFITVGSALGLGALVAFSLLVTAIVLLYVGRAADFHHTKGVLRSGVVIYASAWFLRLFASAWGAVAAVDTLSRVGKSIISVPVMSDLYERAGERSLIKTAVLFEMSLSLGKLIMAGVLAVIFALAGPIWNVAFILSALATLLYGLLAKKRTFYC